MFRTAALTFVLFVAPLCAQTADEKKASVAYLLTLRQADGGFLPATPNPTLDQIPKSSLRATSAAARAIRYLGDELKDREKSAAFVRACYDAKSGIYADRPGGIGDVTTTAVGMMAAAELEPKTHFADSIEYLIANAKTFEERRLAVAGCEAATSFPRAIKHWFDVIDKSANADGTHGTGDGRARQTASVAAMILRTGTGIPACQRKAILSAIRDGQRADGGFGKADAKGSDLETSYRVMRALHLMKEQPADVKKLTAFIARCRNKDGGYGVEPGQLSGVSGTYYAAVIGKWLTE